ncbi:MAG: hypothetical protein IJ518_00925 [Clostridia bacterium]|nr:hypothetical protein [Clostridia bacterium]
MSPVITITLPPPPFCEREALRYAGCGTAEEETRQAILACYTAIQDELIYKVCYRELPVKITGQVCDFDTFSVTSQNLADTLAGCNAILLMAATVGVGLDRYIARFGRISPSRALLFQAIGTERIEALCDAFCQQYSQQNQVGLRPRFSPGYGDLPLETQRQIFALLDCPRQLGLCLNDSLLMSPSKSVTAIVGITAQSVTEHHKCKRCQNTACPFRSNV